MGDRCILPIRTPHSRRERQRRAGLHSTYMMIETLKLGSRVGPFALPIHPPPPRSQTLSAKVRARKRFKIEYCRSHHRHPTRHPLLLILHWCAVRSISATMSDGYRERRHRPPLDRPHESRSRHADQDSTTRPAKRVRGRRDTSSEDGLDLRKLGVERIPLDDPRCVLTLAAAAHIA
jgi:hypothetical protein